MQPTTSIGDELDGYVVTREVEELTAYTRRWLYHLVKAKKFPPPDIPGRTGAAHRWRRSTIKRALAEMASSAPSLPTDRGPALPKRRKPPRATAAV